MDAHPLRAAAALLASAWLLAACGGSSDSSDADPVPPPVASTPNILVFIMDDVGIDQMTSFGYGGQTPPQLPNIDTIADGGIRFRNTWAMPECSPSRAALFVGRYPVRTNINQAIGPNDSALSQVSPFEVTAPKLLKAAGYESAMFGKFHLAGPHHNQAGVTTPSVLGWDYFYGWVDGVPGSIDTTAGGVAEGNTRYSCGFVPNAKAAGGADTGACYYADNSCVPMQGKGLQSDAPGLQCLESGGIFVPKNNCGDAHPPLNFKRENAHYVSPLVIIDNGKLEEVPLDDARGRGYRTRIEANAAIDWIKARTDSAAPWMATVSFSAAHTPIQPPPHDMVPGGTGLADLASCEDFGQMRVLQNRMTEALDSEIGRILIETGIAKRGADGALAYDPKASNTMVVIIGDNGTFGFAVKEPFNPQRAKGTAYQTGVWVPLIVAGPQVEQPNRDVGHMVNVVDLFQLFGEVAGIDVHQAVPRPVDAAPMLAYLENPRQDSVRSLNFAISGFNIQDNGGQNGPCVMDTACTQIPMSKSVCEDNQGVWWGEGYDEDSVIDNGGKGYKNCCAVNQALAGKGLDQLNIFPERSVAVRDATLKLVRNTTQSYDATNKSCGYTESDELYLVNEEAPKPLLDNPEENLLGKGGNLEPAMQKRYEALVASMESILASDPACPGDGNRDGVVNEEDMANWRRIAQEWGQSSVYDMFIDGQVDGLTNALDAQIIQQNMGKTCPKAYAQY